MTRTTYGDERLEEIMADESFWMSVAVVAVFAIEVIALCVCVAIMVLQS